MQVVHGWDLESCSESAQNFQNLFVGKIWMNKMFVKTVKTRVEWINLREVSGLTACIFTENWISCRCSEGI